MGAYVVRRLLLIVPTLFAIMLVNFAVVQLVPGGPIERVLAQLDKSAVSATARVSGGGGETLGSNQGPSSGGGTTSRYRGAQGLDPDFIRSLEVQFGLDKPVWERFLLMMGNYLRFDFGNSYFRDKSVASLVFEKMPVSISLGVWTALLTYLISIPLGISKAVRDALAVGLVIRSRRRR
jgi:microcin C transport system permease protein